MKLSLESGFVQLALTEKRMIVAAYLFYRLLRLEESFERDPDTEEGINSTRCCKDSGHATEATESYLKDRRKR